MKQNAIKNICVYCGSGNGLAPRYAEAARTFGRLMAESGVRLIYGGGSNGLMGEVARSVLTAGGHVTGIIPESLISREKPLAEAQEMIVVGDLHERKMLMFEKSDAFVALPGGIGTLEELVEQLTWVQLDLHAKPVVIANIDRYWDPLLALLDQMHAQTFIRDGLVPKFAVIEHVEDIMPRLEDFHRKGGRAASDDSARHAPA